MKLYERSYFSRPYEGPGFYLVRDNWNDYGYQTLFELYYFDGETDYPIGAVKIGNHGGDFKTSISELINKGNNNKIFSLGTSKNYYLRLNNLEEKNKNYILKILNDIAFNLDLFEQVENYEITRSSLLRGIYPKTVRDQFHRITEGKAELTEYEFEFVKDDIEINFKVQPHSKPPSNLHGIIGSNGVGKTKLLKDILSSFLNSENHYLIDKNPDTLGYEDDDLFANALFISFSIFDSLDIKKNEKFEYIGVQRYSEHKQSNSINKSNDELAQEFSDSLREIVGRSEDRKEDNKEKWLEKVEELKMTDAVQNIVKKFSESNNKESYEKLFKREFNNLSSGQKIVILSVTRMIEKVTEKSLLLIDEPEMYLHPPLLASYMKVISSILNEKNGVGIISTHSPIVMQELKRDNVNIIKKTKNAKANRFITKPNIETYGENIGLLSREVFRLEIEDSGYYEELLKDIKKFDTYDAIIEEYDGALGVEAKSILRVLLRSK